MSRPTLLVLTLLVLWLIVLVPMIFRRVDDGAQARSVRQFGRSMRLLSRRHAHGVVAAASAGGGRFTSAVDEVSYVAPRVRGPRDDLFVAGMSRQRTRMNGDGGRRPASPGQEGPIKQTEMSEARRQMMARRRRSLTTLIAGAAISLLLAMLVGGIAFAFLATVFCLGLGGYVYFLRSQALRDRERRAWRAERELEHERLVERETFASRLPEVDDMDDDEYFEQPATMVRIDDDHVDLHNLDTIDLTGIYNENDYQDLRERRAS